MAGIFAILRPTKEQSSHYFHSALECENVDTFNEVEHLRLHVFKKESNTDSGEVAVSHLLVSQHPLEEPLQMGLRGLQALTTPG